MNATQVAARCYSALLRLYPRPFRDEFRSDMELLFRDQCRDEPVWRVTGRAAIDLALTIPIQHLERHMKSQPAPILPLLFTLVAIGGLLLAITGGSEPVSLAMGLGLVVAAGGLAIVAWRRIAPVPTLEPSRTWWVLVLSGFALIVLVIAASGVGVQAWYLGLLTVLTAFVLIAAGLGLGANQAVKRLRQGGPAM